MDSPASMLSPIPGNPGFSSPQSDSKQYATEKPLPPSPPLSDRAMPRLPSGNADVTPSKQPSTTSSPALSTTASFQGHVTEFEQSPTAIRPAVSTAASFQRPKKRVAWRGKTCIIALPLDDGRFEHVGKDPYLSPIDVANRLQRWEIQGYDTKGFGISSTIGDFGSPFSEGQSRALYPDPEDEKRERLHFRCRVSIPDRREWEAYVSMLKEEKLRALGVSFRDDESSRRESPARSFMSRQVSSQSIALPISPLSSTTGGQVTHHGNPASHSFQGPPSSSSHVSSLVSPAPQYLDKPKVSHVPRYSVALPAQSTGFPTPFQFPQKRSRPGDRSPQQHPASQLRANDASPTASVRMQNLGGARIPPLSSSNRVTNHGSISPLSQMRQQQAQLQAQQLLQQHQQQQLLYSRSQEFSVASQGPKRQFHSNDYKEQPEIATPVPRGHRQNLSETLQREVDEAESQLEASMSQVEEEGEKQSETEGGGKDEISEHVPILTDKFHIGDRYIKNDGSDLDTNPSLAGTPPPLGNRLDNPRLGHKSKPSASKLNVNAPIFMLEPRRSHSPDVFAFLGNKLSSASSTDEQLGILPGANQSRHKSSGSIRGSSLNVSAPTFTPSNTNKPTAPSREFSFSSNGPCFKPDAPSFEPNESQLPDTDVKKIFGNISFSEVIRPPKKSRAIPIIKPDNDPEDSDRDADGQEDESGRITQPDGRQKRVRRNDDDGDQTPLFAIPSHSIPSQATETKALDSMSVHGSTANNGEDATTLQKPSNRLEEIINELSASDISSLTGDREPVDAEGKPWEPFTFEDVGDAADFNTARPSSLEQRSNKVELDAAKIEKTEILDSLGQVTGSKYGQNDYPDVNMYMASNAFCESSHRTANPEIASSLAVPDSFENQPDVSASDTEMASQFAKDCLADSRSVSTVSPSLDRPRESLPSSREYSEESRSGPTKRSLDQDLVENIVEGVTYIEPSYQEIDAVMKHLNEEDSDLGVERNCAPIRPQSPAQAPLGIFQDPSKVHQFLPNTHIRSDAPSPSPRRLQHSYQYLPGSNSESADTADVEMIARNARFSPSYRPSRADLDEISPIHRLNSSGDVPISDWDDAFSSVDEDLKLGVRAGFFDTRVNDLIGKMVQQRLDPVEKALADIQESLMMLSSRSASRKQRGSFSGEVEKSDADDEDDLIDSSEQRVRSPFRDRKYEKLKAAFLEVTNAQQKLAPMTELTEMIEAVKGLKGAMQHTPHSPADIKTIVEEAIGRQMRGRSAPITSSSQSATAEKQQLQITGLESMLKIADTRAEDELKARRATEDALADAQRLLRSALHEAAEQRESAEETERSLQAFHDERHQGLRHTAMLEGAQESLRKTAADLSEKNFALEDTLEEYRLSSTQWRGEIEEAKTETKDLRSTIHALKGEIEDSIKGRHILRNKFDRLQGDMTQALHDIARDQCLWRNRENEHNARINLLSAGLEDEGRTRQRLELEITRLEAQEKERVTTSSLMEQTQAQNTRLMTLLEASEAENREYQNATASLERELHNAEEIGKLEIERTRIAQEADAETASKKLSTVRGDLEGLVEKLQIQLADVIAESCKIRARYELMLEEASDSRSAALREAAEAREVALQEHYRFHERTLEELRTQHQRAIGNALEDKNRSEVHFADRLFLADKKVQHYEERITHLEEKLEISKSAAHAAAQAAQSQLVPSSPSASRVPLPVAKDYEIPERISPQALRESIMVLQEQLQEREGRIEQFEQELSGVDKDAAGKVKEQEMEITWLRELLGVRIDDLEDIILTLSQPSYDREKVKDATIRLKANLQMEQQEKERASAGGKTFPSLASISSLASSPRALPLAAAAAWGNWRKARDTSFGNLSAIANGSVNNTPSRASPSTQSFLSGLMTPPSTGLRSTPQSASGMTTSRPTASSSKRLGRPYSTSRQSLSLQYSTRPLRPQDPPATPSLMRKASYDQDAVSSGYNDGCVEEGEAAGEEPFGPRIEPLSTSN